MCVCVCDGARRCHFTWLTRLFTRTVIIAFRCIRNFEISRSIVASGKGTRRLVDNARVNLGMSRGNAQIGAYLNVISYDISSLLLWKNRRLEFDQRAGRKSRK